MGAPNDEEIELIKKLRENVQDLDLDEEVLNDINLIRWLRARNHNLKDAEGMFRKYINWFDEMKLESIFTLEIPKELTDELKQSILGLDNDGCPIALIALDQLNIAKLVGNGHRPLVLYCMQIIERNAYFVRYLMAEQEKNDSLILISAIYDLEGLSWRYFTFADAIHAFVTIAKNIEAYYPETINKIIFINAPRAFTLLWSLIKPFISEKTMEKIQIHGQDRQQWQPALLKLAPKGSLPKKYGGVLPGDVDILPKCHECVPKKRGSY